MKSPEERRIQVAGAERAGDPLTEQMIEDLRELITALDRRVPHLERASEIDIARDAVALRRKAEARIEELKRSVP